MTGKWFRGIIPSREKPAEIDTTIPHSARIYNYWLGGKDNFEVDRVAARQTMAANPGIVADARTNRAFLVRAVRYLTAEAGIRQFLDIGTGLPTANNTHDVAQAAAPQSRIVYVDNDPLVLSHARALLTSTPEGATAYLDADLRQPGAILEAAAATLDFKVPVALMLLIILHMIPDDQDPHGLVKQLLAALPSGSYLVLSHVAKDVEPERVAEMRKRWNSQSGIAPATPRDHAAIARFFDGMEILEPGIVQPPQWRPDPADGPPRSNVTAWCGVGRKP